MKIQWDVCLAWVVFWLAGVAIIVGFVAAIIQIWRWLIYAFSYD